MSITTSEYLTESFDQEVECFDPSCVDEDGQRSMAEPETDLDHQYYTCKVCGNDFGWKRTEASQMAVAKDGSCQIGVPEGVRRAFSPAEEQQSKQPILLGTQIKIGPPSA